MLRLKLKHIFVSSAVECAAIDSLSSGVISIITNGSATRASFDCDPGYNLRGMSDITCSADGTWETSFPFCSMLYKRIT